MAQRIERFDAPQDVFQAIVGNAVRLNGSGSNAEDILHELNNNEDLASVRLVHFDDSNQSTCVYTSVTAFEFYWLSCYA